MFIHDLVFARLFKPGTRPNELNAQEIEALAREVQAANAADFQYRCLADQEA